MARAERIAWIGSLMVPVVFITSLTNPPLWWVMLVVMASPLVVIAMTMMILRDPAPPPADLPAGHEWGYADRPDLRPQE